PLNHGGLEMGVIPCTPDSVKCLEQWKKADVVLADEIYTRIADQTHDPEGEALTLLQAREADFDGDSFLQSVYWNEIQELQVRRGNISGAIEALQNGIRLGFPNAYFYDSLGNLLKQEGRQSEADRDFAKAKVLLVQNPIAP
ncbi:MAG TPA: hypothetical protein VN963_01155, partial [bacterium]|nr:hypothetical protein [bacterium]